MTHPKSALFVVSLAMFAVTLSAQGASGPFDAPVVRWTDTERVDHLVDLNGDGLLDALGWYEWGSSTRVRGWNNDGSGGFTQRWELLRSEKDDEAPFPVGDVDGDTREDFFLILGSNVWVYKTRLAGAPLLRASWDEGFDVEGAVAADFDDDGEADILTMVELGDGSYELRLRLNLGGGSAFSAPVSANVGSIEPTLAQGDLHATPGDEFIVTTDVVRIHPVVGGVPQSPIFEQATGLQAGAQAVVGDVDGDGDEDVVLFENDADPRYVLLRSAGLGSYAAEGALAGGPATDLFDADGDGDLDGVCCGGSNPTPNSEPADFRIATNTGGGAFEVAATIRGLGARWLAGVTDLDGNGYVDLVAGRCIYYAAGPLEGTLQSAVPAGAPVGAGAAFDVDRDGDPDLGVGLESGVRNRGDGTFVPGAASAVVAPAGTYFEGPGFPVDVEGDGDADLVVSHFQDDLTFLSMRLLVNMGGGHFVDAGAAGAAGVDFNFPFQERNTALHAIVEDVEADGDADLLVLRRSGLFPWTQVWENDGTGSFSAGALFQNGNAQGVAEVTGDTLLDVVVLGANDVHVYPGLGSGAFDASYLVPGFRRWHLEDRMGVADFDGDGDVDLVQRDAVQFNDGFGAFGSLLDLDLNHPIDEPFHIDARDVNGDGYVDLMMEPLVKAGDATAVFLWDPVGDTFEDELLQVLGAGVYADLDGDGDPDFVGDRMVANRTVAKSSTGRRRQRGAGLPGTAGLMPILGAVGPFEAGAPVEYRVTNVRGGTPGVLLREGVASQRFGLGAGNFAFVNPIAFVTDGLPGVAGAGSASLLENVPPTLAGVSVAFRAWIFDPGASGGLARTNRLVLRFH